MTNISNNKEIPASPASPWPEWIFSTSAPASPPEADDDPAEYQPVSEPHHDDDRREGFLDYSDWCWTQIEEADFAYLTGPRRYPPPCFYCGGRLVHSKPCAELQAEQVPAVPFGRYKGKRLDEVPFTYLAWLSRESDCNSELKTAAKSEIERRKAG